MSEPVLERSVLERKERDELKTIVEALGAKAPARAKKADLVDLILTTAGVAAAPAAGGNGDAPEVPPAIEVQPVAAADIVEAVAAEAAAPAHTNGDRVEGDESREPRGDR